MDRQSDLREIRGIGDNLAEKFYHLGVRTVDDLIHYWPRRYNDFSRVTKIKDLKPGQVTITATISSVKGHYARRGLHITEGIATDGSGSVRLTWFNQPYRENSFKTDTAYFLTGKYELKYRRFAIFNPITELVSDFPINTARIVPKYPETKGLSSYDIRRAISQLSSLITSTSELLPEHIIKSFNLVSYSEALINIHFPKSTEDLAKARQRLSFDELFLMILASELNKLQYKKDSAQKIEFDLELAKRFVDKLPFNLTDDQRKAVWQIYKDMAKTEPMNRLIEGDVGSGKTAVAAMAGLMVVNNGKQVLFMAPTELLARQHAETVRLMFKSVGLEDKVGLLIGAMSVKDKSLLKADIKAKKIMFVIGTHALIEESLESPDLALIIVDEQHRFGVKQRQALKLKAKYQPHALSLSATPIPRSLALTLFGELNIARLKSKPHARAPVKTALLSESMLDRQLAGIKEEIKSGRQMFIVGSSIDADTNYSTTAIQTWAKSKFTEFNVGLIYGRMKADEKATIMRKFVDRQLDILIATTVIEVGIDVPNATIMIIFDADNFGLAQLHQLRGRVGRGEHPGRAFLVYPDNDTPSDRLRALESSNDGFKLAELDLSIRGPGAIYGQLQHGLLDLRMAGLDDIALIKQAREAAKQFVENGYDLLKYPVLSKQVKTLQKLTNLN